MKLNKILIPLGAIAGITAVVAPLATSCSCSSALAIKQWRSADGNFQFEYPPKAAQTVDSKEKATRLYYNDIKNIPTILCEDFVWDFARKPMPGQDTYNLARVELYSLTSNSDNSSFKISFKFFLDTTTAEGKHIEETFDYKNVWFRVVYLKETPTEEKWRLEYINLGNSTELWNDHEWSLSYFKTVDGAKEPHVDYNYRTKDFDAEKAAEAEMHLCVNLWFYSYYLKNINLG